jgi:hypothetical protein
MYRYHTKRLLIHMPLLIAVALVQGTVPTDKSSFQGWEPVPQIRMVRIN